MDKSELNPFSIWVIYYKTQLKTKHGWGLGRSIISVPIIFFKCVLVVTLLLFYAGFRLAAYLSRCRIPKLCLALLRSGREFHSKLQASGYTPSSVYPIAGYLFCTVASCLQLIIANSNACNEGGVSSLLSNPRASTRHCLNAQSILI